MGREAEIRSWQRTGRYVGQKKPGKLAHRLLNTLKGLYSKVGLAESGIVRDLSKREGGVPRYATDFDYPLSLGKPFNCRPDPLRGHS